LLKLTRATRSLSLHVMSEELRWQRSSVHVLRSMAFQPMKRRRELRGPCMPLQNTVVICVRTIHPVRDGIKEKKFGVVRANLRGISKDTEPWVEQHEPVRQWMKVIQENRTSWPYALKNPMQVLGNSPEWYSPT
jgi:hypothetical protein